MTDTTPADENTDAATEPNTEATPEAEDTVDTPAEDADQSQNPNAEAAKWRHRFRDEETSHAETRAALDAMTGRVEALQRQQVESLVAASGAKPAAVWATAELAALLADDGTVDPKAVAAAVAKARDELGIRPVGKGARVRGVGNRPDTPPQVEDRWAAAFGPKR